MAMKFIVSAGGILLKDKRILLIKRAPQKKSFPNCWGLPGGKIEDSDTSVEAGATREVKEETNLDFFNLKRLGFYEYCFRDRDIVSVSHLYLGDFRGDEKPQKEEVSEMRWYSYEEAISLDLAFRAKEVIEELHEKSLL